MSTPTLQTPDFATPVRDILRPRMPELDTIRGIAVLFVLFFHGFGFRYGVKGLAGFPKLFVAATLAGWVGVNLFFVLSGFLITGILLDTKFDADYYSRFYVRRALRILPLYYAVLAILAVLTRAGWTNRSASWAFLGLSFFYLSNVTALFGVALQYGVLWSLAVEEHFYLLWPAAVRSLSRSRVAILGLIICVVCPCLRGYYFIRGYNTGTGYTWLVADGLATGAVLAALARGFTGNTHWYAACRDHISGSERHNVYRQLSFWNIPSQQTPGPQFAGNRPQPFLWGLHCFGVAGGNFFLEGSG